MSNTEENAHLDHFVHDIMYSCFDYQHLLSSFCRINIFSMVLMKDQTLQQVGIVPIPYNSATLSRALAEPLLRRRNVLFEPTNSV